MQIQINTDHNVEVNEKKAEGMEEAVASTLAHFGERITRVEVHLRDDSAGRESTDDHRCLIEARPAGMDPVVVTDHADSADQAFNGALDKIESLLQNKFDRLSDKRGHDSIRKPS